MDFSLKAVLYRVSHHSVRVDGKGSQMYSKFVLLILSFHASIYLSNYFIFRTYCCCQDDITPHCTENQKSTSLSILFLARCVSVTVIGAFSSSSRWISLLLRPTSSHLTHKLGRFHPTAHACLHNVTKVTGERTWCTRTARPL